MAVNIDITIERMKAKDPEAVSFSGEYMRRQLVLCDGSLCV